MNHLLTCTIGSAPGNQSGFRLAGGGRFVFVFFSFSTLGSPRPREFLTHLTSPHAGLQVSRPVKQDGCCAAPAHNFSLISIGEKDETHASLMHSHLKIKVHFELLWPTWSWQIISIISACVCVCLCMYITVKWISAARCEQCFHCRKLAKKTKNSPFPKISIPFTFFIMSQKALWHF